jgi:hypothetical protein
MQFPFANRRTPIQKTDGAESYRVPDRLDGQILGSRRPNYVFNHASVAPGFPMFPPHRRERAVISVFRRKTVRSELCGHIECVQGDGEEHLLVEGNGSIPDQPREISIDGCTGLATEAYYSPSMQLLRC